MRKSRYVTFEINLKSQSQLSRDQLVPQCCGKDARHSRIALADSGESSGRKETLPRGCHFSVECTSVHRTMTTYRAEFLSHMLKKGLEGQEWRQEARGALADHSPSTFHWSLAEHHNVRWAEDKKPLGSERPSLPGEAGGPPLNQTPA